MLTRERRLHLLEPIHAHRIARFAASLPLDAPEHEEYEEEEEEQVPDAAME